jgi:hypothetical protein
LAKSFRPKTFPDTIPDTYLDTGPDTDPGLLPIPAWNEAVQPLGGIFTEKLLYVEEGQRLRAKYRKWEKYVLVFQDLA